MWAPRMAWTDVGLATKAHAFLRPSSYFGDDSSGRYAPVVEVCNNSQVNSTGVWCDVCQLVSRDVVVEAS